MSYYRWIGQIPITTSGRTSCLRNDGGPYPLPTPKNTPTLPLAVTDSADPFGIWWTLTSSDAAPLLATSEIQEYLGGGLIASIADSCTVGMPVSPESSVGAVNFLLETSTSYGPVATSAVSAAPAATLSAQGPPQTVIVDPIATGVTSSGAEPPAPGESTTMVASSTHSELELGTTTTLGSDITDVLPAPRPTDSPTTAQAHTDTSGPGQIPSVAIDSSAADTTTAAPTFTHTDAINAPPAVTSMPESRPTSARQSDVASLAASLVAPLPISPTAALSTLTTFTKTSNTSLTSDTGPIATESPPAVTGSTWLGGLIISALNGPPEAASSVAAGPPSNALQVLTEALETMSPEIITPTIKSSVTFTYNSDLSPYETTNLASVNVEPTGQTTTPTATSPSAEPSIIADGASYADAGSFLSSVIAGAEAISSIGTVAGFSGALASESDTHTQADTSGGSSASTLASHRGSTTRVPSQGGELSTVSATAPQAAESTTLPVIIGQSAPGASGTDSPLIRPTIQATSSVTSVPYRDPAATGNGTLPTGLSRPEGTGASLPVGSLATWPAPGMHGIGAIVAVSLIASILL